MVPHARLSGVAGKNSRFSAGGRESGAGELPDAVQANSLGRRVQDPSGEK